MPFSVRATLVAWNGDIQNYPCHCNLSIGHTIVYDGLNYKGAICPDTISGMADIFQAMYYAGPRYENPMRYNLHWYSPVSEKNDDKTKYDGIGFSPCLENRVENRFHPANFMPKEAYKWPPFEGRPVMKAVTYRCPDLRSAAIFRFEAFDLATEGYGKAYTHRQITIMDRILKNGNPCTFEEILKLYDEFEKYEIYPPLSAPLTEYLIEDCELLNFVEVNGGVVSVTDKGAARVELFKQENSSEVLEALKL